MKGDTITIERSPLKHIGNKFRLIQKYRFYRYFPPIKSIKWKVNGITHKIDRQYIELFCGSAILFFNFKPKNAILNDLDSNIFNFWNVISERFDDFKHELKYTWRGPKWIEKYEQKLIQQPGDPIYKAMLFYLQNSYNPIYPPLVRLVRFEKYLDKVAELMNHCRLEVSNFDFKELLEKIIENSKKFKEKELRSKVEYVIYADPPYVNSESLYGVSFTEEDHYKLSELVHQLDDHHVFLSYNDCDLVRDLYKDFHVKEFITTFNINKKKSNELFISNKPFKDYKGTSLFDFED